MLRELHITNLAVIADASIEFSPGLNCFTGVTGAGKSLVIGAIEFLLALRSPVDLLRPGGAEGRVTGLFEVADPQTLARLSAVTDINLAEHAPEILLTRKLYPTGRSSLSLNGNPITLAMLKAASEHLVDIHGQHDHQYLLKPSNQLEVLDQFGNLQNLRREYAEVYDRVQTIRRQLAELTASGAHRDQQLDLYRFQAGEIDAAELDPAEIPELQARASVLTNLEKLKKDAAAIHASLYEMDSSVLDRLKMMASVLAELATLDAALAATAESLRDATMNLQECAFDLSRYLNRLEVDPTELGEINSRLDTINRVLNKYGDPVEATLAYRQEIGVKIAMLERSTGDASALHGQLPKLTAQLAELGQKLTEQRRKVAGRLAPLLDQQLAELGMEKARFIIELTAGDPAPGGFDQIEFIVQTNPGQLPQPLRKIASGGELSRIMLALKGILARTDRISVLVFDEIDANVGGRLGSVIGQKLRRLAEHHQVLCITHLPQIAAYADRHFTVRKIVRGGKTESGVQLLAGDERIEELSEMIGGNKVTATTRAQARELLAGANISETPKRRSKQVSRS